MFEYALSAGEGTLIDYGVDNIDWSAALALHEDDNGVDGKGTLIIASCSDDCETGK